MIVMSDDLTIHNGKSNYDSVPRMAEYDTQCNSLREHMYCMYRECEYVEDMYVGKR